MFAQHPCFELGERFVPYIDGAWVWTPGNMGGVFWCATHRAFSVVLTAPPLHHYTVSKMSCGVFDSTPWLGERKAVKSFPMIVPVDGDDVVIVNLVFV